MPDYDKAYAKRQVKLWKDRAEASRVRLEFALDDAIAASRRIKDARKDIAHCLNEADRYEKGLPEHA